MIIKHYYNAAIILFIGFILAAFASMEFLQMKQHDKLYPSDGLTSTKMLSDYLPNLLGTNADTELYFFDSGKPGATVLLLGGTHPNEPAGYITAIVLLENINIEAGRFIVIPQACRSGFTCTDPMEGMPTGYKLKTRNGERFFSYGSRVSNPLDQWPDPEVYTHYPSGQELSGFETRNLNRSYPGKQDGSLSERLAYAIIQILKKEKVNVAFDLHEAAPEIPIINAIITHEKGTEIAGTAVLNLEFEDLTYALEISPKSFRGLSHREWGDSTTVIPFLMETSNPIQGRLRGKTDTELIIKGVDKNYKTALESGKLRIEYNPNGEPINLRVARHIEGFRAVIDAYNEFYPNDQFIFENIPNYEEILNNGLTNYLN